MRIDHYKQAIKIDQHKLDTQLVDQMELFSNVALEAAHLASKREQLKADLNRAEAESYLGHRQCQGLVGKKPTEGNLQALIISDEKVIVAKQIFLDAHAEAETWRALKEAYVQRAYLLKDLVQLVVTEHYNVSAMTPSKESEDYLNKSRRAQITEKRERSKASVREQQR